MAVNQVFKNQLSALKSEIDAVLLNVIDLQNYFSWKFLEYGNFTILIRGPNLTKNGDLNFIANKRY